MITNWHAGTCRGVNSNETDQAGAADVITSRSHDKLKHISTTRVPMATKLGRMLINL